MKRLITLLCVGTFACLFFKTTAQEATDPGNDISIDWRLLPGEEHGDEPWFALLNDPKIPFVDVRKAFYKEWEGRPYQKHSGYKQFKRLEFEWIRQGMPNHLHEHDSWAAYEAYKEQQAQSVNRDAPLGNWTFIGPSDPPDPVSANNGGIGRIDAIAFHPTDSNIIFVGAPTGGLWKTTDGGSTWNSLSDDWGMLGVSWIVVDPTNPDIIYAATGDRDAFRLPTRGIQKSTDGGLTWTRYAIDGDDYLTSRIHRLVINELNPNVLLAATNYGLYKSYNGGQTWEHRGDTLVTKDVEYKPGDTSVVYVAGPNTLFKSTDGGESFSTLVTPFLTDPNYNIRLSTTPANSNVLVVACYSNTAQFLEGVYKSNDSGTSFIQIGESPQNGLISAWRQGFYNWCVRVNPQDENDILLGAVELFRTTDNGLNWQNVWATGNIHVDMHTLQFSPHSGKAHVGCDGGLYREPENGLQWDILHFGLGIPQIYGFGHRQLDTNALVMGGQDNGAFIKDGDQWNFWLIGDRGNGIIDPVNSDVQFTSSMINGALFRTEDQGSTTKTSFSSNFAGEIGGTTVIPIEYHPVYPNVLYLAYQNVWKSEDNGLTWERLSEGLGTQQKAGFDISFSDSDIMYCLDFSESFGSVHYSLDGGMNWQIGGWPVGFESSTVTHVEVHNDSSNIIYLGHNNGKAFKSNDYGQSWMDITGTLPLFPRFAVNKIIHQRGTDDLYAATDVGVFYKNGDLDWVPFNNGLPSAIISDVHINYNANKLIISTYGRGMWSSDLAESNSFCYLDAIPAIQETDNISLCTDTTYTLHGYPSPIGYTIQWYRNNELISGAHGDSLTVNETGEYYYRYAGPCHSFASNLVEVTYDCVTQSCASFNINTTNGPGNITTIDIPKPTIVPDTASTVELCLALTGDFNRASERFLIYDEDNSLRDTTSLVDNDCGKTTHVCFSFDLNTYDTWIQDGFITVSLDPISLEINPELCAQNNACAYLRIIPDGSCGFHDITLSNKTCFDNNTIVNDDDRISLTLSAENINGSAFYLVESNFLDQPISVPTNNPKEIVFSQSSALSDIIDLTLIDLDNENCRYELQTSGIGSSCSNCPDIIIKSAQVDTIIGNFVRVNYIIKNNGLDTFDLFGVSIQRYLSQDTFPDPFGTTPAGGGGIDPVLLPPMQEIEHVIGANFSDLCDYPFILTRLNHQNRVFECDYSNNWNFLMINPIETCACPSVICGCTNSDSHNHDQGANLNDNTCETCNDGIKNGDETGIDCGGSLCQPCAPCSTAVNIGEISYCDNSIILDSIVLANDVYDIGLTINNSSSVHSVVVFQGRAQILTSLSIGQNIIQIDSISDGYGCSYAFANEIDTFQVTDECILCSDGLLNGNEIRTDCGGSECAPCQCTNFIFPEDGFIDVPVQTSLTWTPIDDAIDYVVVVGTCISCSDIIDSVSVGDTTRFSVTGMPYGTNIYATILPVDNIGIRTDCEQIMFTTRIQGCTDPNAHNYNALATVDDGSCLTCFDGLQNGDETEIDCGGVICQPCNCPEILYPLDQTADVPADTTLYWMSDPDNVGYILSVGTCSSCSDLIDSVNVGNVNSYPLSALPYGSNIYYRVIAIDGGGPVDGCLEYSFRTVDLYGCTDSTAHNYNPLATIENGSCQTCFDGVQNGDEEDIDCGGVKCISCNLVPCTDTLAIWSIPPLTGSTPFNEITLNEIQASTTGGVSIQYFPSWTFAELQGTESLTFDPDDYFEFGLSSSNDSFLVGSLHFDLLFTYNGATNWSLRSSLDGFSSDLTTGSVTETYQWERIFVEIGSGVVTDEIDFRIYGWGGNSSISSLRFDNLIIKCGKATCSDGILNGTETAVDCGGADCLPCSTPTVESITKNNALCATSPTGEIFVTLTSGSLPPYDVSYSYVNANGDTVGLSYTTGLHPIILENLGGDKTYDIVIEDANAISIPITTYLGADNDIDLDIVVYGDSITLVDKTNNGTSPFFLEFYDLDFIYYFYDDMIPALPFGVGNLPLGDYEAYTYDSLFCADQSVYYFTIDTIGCTNPQAHNYNPIATVDDGSCETCTDGVQNGDETDIDCGGVRCDPCPCVFEINTDLDNGLGSLPEAISCANVSPGIDTISFALPGPGPHIILFSSPISVISDDLYILNNSGENVTIDASALSTLFEINGGIDVHMEGFDIIAPSIDPAKVFINAGNLTVKNMIIQEVDGGTEGITIENTGNLDILENTNIENDE